MARSDLVDVPVYDATGRPTWVFGVGGHGSSPIRIELFSVAGTNLCPGCSGPTSYTTTPAGTLDIHTDQLGAGQLVIDLALPIWPRLGALFQRIL